MVDISAQIPRTLDSLVRRNRHRVRIDLATPAEIDGLSRRVDRLQPRQTLVEWRVIAFRFEADVQFHLLGRTEHQEPWITSYIAAIDQKLGLVRTRNSIYGILGDPRVEPPDLEQVLCVAAWLNGTLLGEWIDVPHVYY